MKIKYDSSVIDRMHRVGKKISKDGKTYQSIIIKFKSWTTRTEFYKSRPKSFNNDGTKKPGSSYGVSIDLTKRRYDLLKHAKSVVGQHPRVSFAFADINCALGIKTVDDNFFFFNSHFQLEKVLAQL